MDGGASEAEELTACKEFCLRAGWVASRRALFDDAARIVLSRPTDRVVEGESAAMAMLRVSVDTLRAAEPEKWARMGMAAAEFGKTAGDLMLAFARATSSTGAAAAVEAETVNVDRCVRKLETYVESMHRNWDAYMCTGLDCAAGAPAALASGSSCHPHPLTASKSRPLWLYSRSGVFTSRKPSTNGAVVFYCRPKELCWDSPVHVSGQVWLFHLLLFDDQAVRHGY